MANAARGLPQLAYLLQVFPAMERAAWPRSGFHSGASPKKNRLARPDKAMDGKSRPASVSWTPRAWNTDTAGHKGYDAGKKVSGIKRHIAVDTQGLPHAIHVTTADVTDRAGALAMFDRRRDGLSQVQNVLVDGGYTGKPFATAVQGLLGAAVEVVKRNELHTFVVLPKRWVVERSFAWLEKCRRLWKNCERKLNTSLQMVVLAFTVLILKRL